MGREETEQSFISAFDEFDQQLDSMLLLQLKATLG
jgi:hypothetical protein